MTGGPARLVVLALFALLWLIIAVTALAFAVALLRSFSGVAW